MSDEIVSKITVNIAWAAVVIVVESKKFIPGKYMRK